MPWRAHRLMLRDSARRIVRRSAIYIRTRACRETSNYCYSHFNAAPINIAFCDRIEPRKIDSRSAIIVEGNKLFVITICWVVAWFMRPLARFARPHLLYTYDNLSKRYLHVKHYTLLHRSKVVIINNCLCLWKAVSFQNLMSNKIISFVRGFRFSRNWGAHRASEKLRSPPLITLIYRDLYGRSRIRRISAISKRRIRERFSRPVGVSIKSRNRRSNGL